VPAADAASQRHRTRQSLLGTDGIDADLRRDS
jgi:hypothetical protein